MNHPANDKDTLERIGACSGRVVVLRGPAATGKTSAVVAMYRRFLDPAGRPRCLIVAPNPAAAQALRRRLLQETAGGLAISPAVMTFADLAGRVLSAAGRSVPILPPFRRRLLLRRIVDELAGAKKLSALSAVADTAGAIVQLDRAIGELKRAAVEPETLAAAVPASDAKGRDLLEVYRRYQRQLVAGGAYDAEGRMWLGRDCLATACSCADAKTGLEGFEAIAVDGFTDFTPTQLNMLAAISRRVRPVVITLPYSPDERRWLWQWTHQTLETIRRTFAADLEEIALDDAAPAAKLQPIWDRLFETDPAPAEWPEGLQIISAAGIDAELAAVARRIKRLLADGETGGIAVLARSMDRCRGALERIFAAHHVPVAAAATPLIDAPIVRFALNVAALGPTFACTDVLGVIKNSYFRPQALGAYGPTTTAVAEMIVREGNVLEGRRAYAQAARRLGRPQASDDEEDVQLGPLSARPEDIAAAGQMLQKLFDLSEAAQDSAGLIALVEALSLPSAARAAADAELIARDLRALAALHEALGGLDDRPVRLDCVREALAAVNCPAVRGESLVEVMDVLQARAIRWRHVFLLNVTEGAFPQAFADSAILSEAQRRRLLGANVTLDARGDLAAREMLLFYLAVARADGALTISYCESDAGGAAAAPSSFLTALVEPFGGLAEAGARGAAENIPPGEPLPPPDALASARDAANAAIAGLFDDQPSRWREAMRWAAANRGETIRRAARGLWTRHRRWSPGRMDSYDGRISEKTLLKRLEQRYPGETVFSASQLGSYAQCPWQFFGHYVLKLLPLSQPVRRLEPVARGIFCHDVLFGVMGRLRDRCGGPVRLGQFDEGEITEALDQAVAEAADQAASRHPPYPLLWDIQRRQMHQQMREYLLALRSQTDLPGQCLHFELGFGVAEADVGRMDPASRAEPVTIETPAGEIRVRGKIDRVDRVSFDGAEKLLVIDYKTGRLPAQKEIRSGLNVQLVLYAAAAEAILNAECFGGAFHRIGAGRDSRERFFAAFKTQRGKYVEMEDFPQQSLELRGRIGQYVVGMAAGRFEPLPAKTCPSYCPFRRICGYSPARAEFKGAAAGGETP